MLPLNRPPAPTDPAEPRPLIASLVVAWNRRDDLAAMLDTLAAQTYPLDRVHLVIVDNASTDGSSEMVVDRFMPDRLIDNATNRASQPAFVEHPRASTHQARQAGGFRSITLIRNRTNLGGCGGYNTALAYTDLALRPDDRGEPVAYAWLHDDDELLAPDALDQLVRTARTDPAIALVGSRMVDPADHEQTVETTVFLDQHTGMFAASPTADHSLAGAHRVWIDEVGTPTGRSVYRGTQDCDLCSAASLLVRWDAVEQVGFWDDRFFIASDDADWCLRFRSAGWRVVCCLDAVVYHLPWSTKRTPARDYYRRRNMIWLWQKSLPQDRLRPLVRARLRSYIAQAWRMGWTRRLTDAEIVRRTAADAIAGRGGKLDLPEPRPLPITRVLEKVSGPRRSVHIALVCPTRPAWRASRQFRNDLEESLRNEANPASIRWTELVCEDVPASHRAPVGSKTRRIVYSRRLRSRLWRQFPLLLRPPTLVVVFDRQCDLPLLTGRWTAQVDPAEPASARLERDDIIARLRFLIRLAGTAVRASIFGRTVRRCEHRGRFNT